jgi:hypothetical protein
MKYLDLNNNEVKELLNVRKDHFIFYSVTLLLLAIGAYLLLKLTIHGAYIGIFVLVIILAYIIGVIFSNRKYLKEIIYKQKKVYRGALSFKLSYKKNKRKKYLFNMDGHTFYVDKRNFESIQEGDIVEFHVSSSTKHLFRIEKIQN